MRLQNIRRDQQPVRVNGEDVEESTKWSSFDRRLMFWAVACVSFQSGFTVDIGFPLKISEVLFAFLFLSRMIQYFNHGWTTVTYGQESKEPKKSLDSVKVVSTILIIWLLCSSAYNLLSTDSGSATNGYTRSLTVDLLLYMGYGLFALFVFSILRYADVQDLMRALDVAVYLCFFAVVLQGVLVSTGWIEPLQVLGFQTSGTATDSVFGDTVDTRSGPFVEGQHLGFFSGATALLAIIRGRYLLLAMSVFSLVYSQSTTGIIALIVGLMLALIAKPTRRVLLTTILAACLLVFGFFREESVRTFILSQVAKLGIFDIEEASQGATLSLDLRSIKTNIGFLMAGDHPLFGVGPGRYGSHFLEYSDGVTLPPYYYHDIYRPIAENVYAQVAAELGLIGLLLFLSLLLVVAVLAFRSTRVSDNMIAFPLVGYLIFGIASQSNWTFLPIWCLLTLCCIQTGGDDSSQEDRGIRSSHG